MNSMYSFTRSVEGAVLPGLIIFRRTSALTLLVRRVLPLFTASPLHNSLFDTPTAHNFLHTTIQLSTCSSRSESSYKPPSPRRLLDIMAFNGPMATSSPFVTLISSDGFEFHVRRSAACVSATIRRMLDPQSKPTTTLSTTGSDLIS